MAGDLELQVAPLASGGSRYVPMIPAELFVTTFCTFATELRHLNRDSNAEPRPDIYDSIPKATQKTHNSRHTDILCQFLEFDRHLPLRRHQSPRKQRVFDARMSCSTIYFRRNALRGSLVPKSMRRFTSRFIGLLALPRSGAAAASS